MCEIDFDGHSSVWDERLIGRARREHRCDTCSCAIAPGSSYVTHFSVFEGDANHEKQCLRCRTIADAFTREHDQRVSPGSLYEYLVHCLDEEPWIYNDDGEVEHVGLSDAGLRWKYAIEEIRARHAARRAAA